MMIDRFTRRPSISRFLSRGQALSVVLGLGLGLGLDPAGNVVAQNRELGSGGELLDGIAAVVNNGIVLKSELADRVDAVAQNFIEEQMGLPPEQRGDLPPLSDLERLVLDQLILEEIQLQRAQEMGITDAISDDAVNQLVAEYANRSGVTLAQFPALLESMGIDYTEFREDQRRTLILTQLERTELIPRVGSTISQREVDQCMARAEASQYDDFEYNISHILIGFSPDGLRSEIDAAEQEARDVVRQLDQGADFAELAVTHSESQTALQGGLLGWRKGSELPTIFADDVIQMEAGEHSTPIRSEGGFHIVRLNDMRGSTSQLVDQVRVRHILLTTDEIFDDDATRQRAIGLREQIIAGDDFETVAAVTSKDGSAVDGGDLGWGQLSDYTPEFSTVIESLEIGEISEPFRTPYGWHIAEVTGRRTYDMSEDLTEAACTNQIGDSKLESERAVWYRRLVDEAYIVKRL